MRNELKQHNKERCGSVLVLTVVALLIMSSLGIGMLAIAYGTRLQAIQQKNEAMAMLAAEAGYEKAVFWMSQQQDMLTTLYNGSSGTTGTITFQGTDCDYSIGFYSFIGAQPVYRIISNGHSGQFNRTVNTLVVQDISGWAMGKCRIPTGATTTAAVNFVNGEIIAMPLHINNLNDSPDARDIYITGSPQFLRPVAMGESRYTAGGTDKYSGITGLFTEGIYFNQGDTKVVDEDTVQSKVDRFKNSTNPSYQFTPTPNASVTNAMPAVQLEFFVDTDGVGKVRITNNCTVRGFEQDSDSKTYDFMITPGSDESHYQRYDIYSYHVRPSVDNRIIRTVDQTYVSQSFGGVESEPGGQIFVNGNVIVGSAGDDLTLPGTKNTVQDKITVVATGNIWIANSTTVAGAHDANGIPVKNNPNVLGLISQGVVKVIDPGMSRYAKNGSNSNLDTGGSNKYPGPPTSVPAGTTYVPVANYQGSGASYNRVLPNQMVVEAAVTVGGGGWGAENVLCGSYGGRREFVSGTMDNLIVRGAITEACRGVVGITGSDGYVKKYYLDSRLLEGVLPGDFWLQGQYVPAPAGWHDYRN
jgi:hypothetical protein